MQLFEISDNKPIFEKKRNYMSSTNSAFKTEGQRFEELLDGLGTQAEAAKALGITQGTVSSLCSLEKWGQTRLERYSPRLIELGRNPEYITNPFVPKFIPRGSRKKTAPDLEEVSESLQRLETALLLITDQVRLLKEAEQQAAPAAAN